LLTSYIVMEKLPTLSHNFFSMKTNHLYYSHNYFLRVLFMFFFSQKQNDVHSFKLIEYIGIDIAKKVKGESANKLTTPNLIAYNGEMPTNNMIKSKSSE